MFSRFMQATLLAVIVLLIQTTKHIYCADSPSDAGESSVLTLTTDTFDDAVKDNKYLLVKFVAPWCGHCKTLQPTYEAAAKQLAESGSDVKLASVDATVEQALATQFGVRGYPTLKFFKDGKATDYTGGRTQDDIISWLKKKTGPSADQLDTVKNLNTFKESGQVVVIGAFESNTSDAANAFLQVAGSTEGIPFGITSNKDVLKELNVEQDTIVLLKQFDEGRNDLTSSINEDSIRAFIRTNELPLVVDFSPQTAQKIFGGEIKLHIILFSSPASDDHKNHREELQTSAKEFRGKLVFVVVDPDQKDNARVQEFFGVKTADLPAVRLVAFDDDVKKFKPDSSDIKSSVLTEFVNAYLDGKLKPHLLSEDIPEDWDKNPLKVLVGKNFQQVTTDQSKIVLVALVAPWCGHCKKLTPIYTELAEKYKDNEDVIIATMDGTTNEVESVKVQGFPTIKLFPKGSDEVIDYNGDRTVEALSKFIDSNGKDDGKVVPEETAEKAEKEGEEPVKKEGEEEEEAHEEL